MVARGLLSVARWGREFGASADRWLAVRGRGKYTSAGNVERPAAVAADRIEPAAYGRRRRRVCNALIGAAMDARDKLLGIYLNDHLAGGSAGLALAHRIASNHRRTTAHRATETIAEEVEEDRDTLLAIMSRLQVRPKRVRANAAVLAERVARLKFNGHLVTRSPLSNVIEFESMRLGVEGKLACWRSLLRVAGDDGRLDTRELESLCERAENQILVLEQLRLDAVADTFEPSS
jgi:hypothetical protein